MTAICPECRQGKHVNCTGEALDERTDELVRCECECRNPTPDDQPLFDGYEPPLLVEDERLSGQQRLTLRQQNHVSAGVHPLVGGQLHPQASCDRTRDSGRSDPFTCGTCTHRFWPGRASNRSFPKCDQQNGKFDTHGANTDVRAWWPACRLYEPISGTDVGVSPLTSVGGG